MELNDPNKAKEFFAAKMAFSTGPVELNSTIEKGRNINVVDVRMAEDYAKGHIPGAVNLPTAKWKSLEGLQKDKVNVLYCYSHVCHLAAKAAVQFAEQGFSMMEMDGGFKAWTAHNLEVEQ